MPVKRRLSKHPGLPRVTPAAIEAFRKMQTAESSDEWWAAHRELRDALSPMTPPWQWPVVADPDDPLWLPSQPGYEDARALWDALVEAAEAGE